MVVGLDLAKGTGAENMVVNCNSQVITSQINGDYECRNERMKKYLEEVKNRISSLEAARQMALWAIELSEFDI